MVIVLALGAAVTYALAMVLQRRTARDVDPALSLRPSLVTTLARRRAWQLGLAVNGVAFVLRAGALARGSLVLVQPLVLSGLAARRCGVHPASTARSIASASSSETACSRLSRAR